MRFELIFELNLTSTERHNCLIENVFQIQILCYFSISFVSVMAMNGRDSTTDTEPKPEHQNWTLGGNSSATVVALKGTIYENSHLSCLCITTTVGVI